MEPTLRVDTALQGEIIHAGSEAVGFPPLFLGQLPLRHIHRSAETQGSRDAGHLRGGEVEIRNVISFLSELH
jgi:hypothetical protein